MKYGIFEHPSPKPVEITAFLPLFDSLWGYHYFPFLASQRKTLGGLDFTEVWSRDPLISLGFRLFDLPCSDLYRGVSDSKFKRFFTGQFRKNMGWIWDFWRAFLHIQPWFLQIIFFFFFAVQLSITKFHLFMQLAWTTLRRNLAPSSLISICLMILTDILAAIPMI